MLGPNAYSVAHFGTPTIKFTDCPPQSGEQRKKLLNFFFQEVLEGKGVTRKRPSSLWRLPWVTW